MSYQLTPLGKRTLIVIVVVLLFIAALVPSVYFYSQIKSMEHKMSNQPETVIDEAKALTEKISRYMDLPQDELPTVATISDVEKLKDQPFFAKAKNGDKVLIYQNSKKAILYDPVADRIIELGPLTVSSPTIIPEPTPISPSPTSPDSQISPNP